MRKIIIGRNDIERELIPARELVRASAIPRLLPEIDMGAYGMTRLHLDFLEILEVYLAIMMETAKRLKNIIIEERAQGFDLKDKLLKEEIDFIHLFSGFASALEASERVDNLGGNVVRTVNSFNIGAVRKLFSSPDLFSSVLSDFHSFLKSHMTHSDPRKRLDSDNKTILTASAYFKLSGNAINEIIRDSGFDCYHRALSELDVNILGRGFRGFSHSRIDIAEDENALLPVTIDDIVGNRELVEAGVKLAKDVAGFDFAVGKNPKSVNPILFALGKPGCGKTVTAHAIGSFFLHYCRLRDIRCSFEIIRRTDWASSYQNASAQQLIGLFREKVAEAEGVVGVYWPDIDTAFAARGDPGLRSEERNILGAAFGIFDGTILPKNGKWFMICDANFINMDKATISRITQNPYFVKGPVTPADFVRIARDIKLREHREFLKLTDEDWIQFGSRCIDLGFSGRSIENISRKVIQEIEDFEFPDEYFKSDYARKSEIIRECSKNMGFSRLLEILDDYCRFEKEAEERSYQERFQDRVEEIISNISARQFVMKKFQEEGSG